MMLKYLISLFMFQITWTSETNNVEKPIDIINATKECQEILEDFAEACSDFMYCSLTNAHPIKVCQSCVGSYNGVLLGYYTILKLEDHKNITCKDELINLDRLEIVESGFKYIDMLWNKAECNNCFQPIVNNTVPFELSNDTKKFQELYADTNQCLASHSIIANNTYNKTVCHDCSQQYNQLNKQYNRMKNEGEGVKVCMDVVDAMNTTRNLWSDVLDCERKPQIPELPLIISCAVCLLIPLFFYTAAWKFGSSTLTTLIQQHRLSQRFRARTASSVSNIR